MITFLPLKGYKGKSKINTLIDQQIKEELLTALQLINNPPGWYDTTGKQSPKFFGPIPEGSELHKLMVKVYNA